MSREVHNRAWWRETIAEYTRSGLTARVFAAERGLQPGTFKWWRSVLAREVTADLVRVEVVESA
jgi:hypothetical protein